MPQKPKVLKLDEVEALPGPGTLTWHPVRHTLGIRAFGCNAYTASTVGADVVEPHTEDVELAHEELYFVASGRAIFTIDEQRFDAPSGTYVFIPDPRSHRHAVAAEPGTTVLSFGGPPTFTPSAWEWAFRAAGTRGSDPEAARVILQEGLAAHPEDPSLLYQRACLGSICGQPQDALADLARAISVKPEIKAWARQDEDFEPLRGDPRFIALTSD
jgi:mannose-6-phosphate isomerase-like protein (cupin superfamily)